MEWEVEYTDDFGQWWNGLRVEEQTSVDRGVILLQERGPSLPYPYSSDITTSRHSHMRELRIQHEGRPYRVLYAFDPRRCGVLLIGGEKTGDERWYERYVPIEDRLYDAHLEQLRKEGKLEDG